MMGILKGH